MSRIVNETAGIALALFANIALCQKSQLPTFGKDIYPIIKAKCLGCHSIANSSAWFVDSLSLDTYQGLMDGGINGQIVTPGDANSSYLMRAILPPNAGGRKHDRMGEKQDRPYMPLVGESLNPDEVQKIREWIDAGAIPGSYEDVEEKVVTLSDVPMLPGKGFIYCLPHFVSSESKLLRMRVLSHNPARTLRVDWNAVEERGQWVEWTMNSSERGDSAEDWPQIADVELKINDVFPVSTVFIFSEDRIPPALLEKYKQYTKFSPTPTYAKRDNNKAKVGFWLDQPSDVTITIRREPRTGPVTVLNSTLKDLQKGANQYNWEFGEFRKWGPADAGRYRFYSVRLSCKSRTSILQHDITMFVIICDSVDQ